MKRLLLVAYYYPPLAGSGVFRPLRLSKYLPRFGWNVTVLTVSARVRVPKDAALLADVPRSVVVERARTFELRTLWLALRRVGLWRLAARLEPWFMIPDEQVGWVIPARRRGRAILAASRHDAIVSTAAPYSAHLVGLGLQQASGLPWVADFRDEWTTNPYLCDRYPTRRHLQLNRRLEEHVLARADRVACVSAPWLDALRARSPEAPAHKFVLLPNGYDGEHFPEAPPQTPERFRIVYAGAFYGHRSPEPFLEAVRVCLTEGRIRREDTEVVFMGPPGDGGGVPPLGDPAREVLRRLGYRPYFESLTLLREAAVLLLVVPRAGGEGNHTGKLFPYLASRRPILALAPEPNVAADLVRRSRSGVVAPPDDVPAIARALADLYETWRQRRPFEPDHSLVEQYDARRQAADWARVLEEVTRPQRPAASSR